MSKSSSIFPTFLAALIFTLTVWSGTNPHDRAVWYAEVIPAVSVLSLLAATYRIFRSSSLTCLSMSFWLIMHLIGAYYTFIDVLFESINYSIESILGESHNRYNRIARYTTGFYACPMAEWLLRHKLCSLPLALFFFLLSIMSVAAAYEIIEWQYAIIDSGEAGLESLGSQGDIWDAQKGMLADTLGALTSLSVFVLTRPDKRLGLS